ncbi:hypothetical protein NQ317_018621 [Molorchus minor]|uniref:Uncharacterized protein n=1 Tax=Molorchus minor TaxID=1323400 RepID=A0ABQ9IV37_9CUCU|nr:hypothetical protein NQ317_018621 [Molorchus minor]
MSGSSVFKNGVCLTEGYGMDLDKLNQEDRVGLMRTSEVTITSPAYREHNNDDCLSGSSVLAIDNDILNVTLGGDLSELSMSSSNSLDIRMDMNVR